MENKNHTMSPALNTINIAYSMRTQDIPSSSQRKKLENSLQYPYPIPRLSEPSPKNGEDLGSPETVFNDFNLKYGKSQTLKESVFNRMRIHIYRREKKPKWLQLPAYRQDGNDVSDTAEPQREQNKSLAKNRQNKSSLNRRNEIEASYRPPIKTTSSEEAVVVTSKRKMNQHYREFEMIDQQRINSIVKNLLEQAKYEQKTFSKKSRNQKNDAFKITRRKSRNLSESINSFSRRHPNELKKLFSPPILKQGTNPKQNNAYRDEKGRQIFQAWENSDIFGSHRSGIVEYTKQYMNPESANAKQVSEGDGSSTKKKKGFLIREKK